MTFFCIKTVRTGATKIIFSNFINPMQGVPKNVKLGENKWKIFLHAFKEGKKKCLGLKQICDFFPIFILKKIFLHWPSLFVSLFITSKEINRFHVFWDSLQQYLQVSAQKYMDIFELINVIFSGYQFHYLVGLSQLYPQPCNLHNLQSVLQKGVQEYTHLYAVMYMVVNMYMCKSGEIHEYSKTTFGQS